VKREARIVSVLRKIIEGSHGEVVYRDHLLTARDQRIYHVGTDESGRSRYRDYAAYRHSRLLLHRGVPRFAQSLVHLMCCLPRGQPLPARHHGRQARERGQDPAEAAARHGGGWLLFPGRVAQTEWDESQPYMYGIGTNSIAGSGPFSGHTFAIWSKT